VVVIAEVAFEAAIVNCRDRTSENKTAVIFSNERLKKTNEQRQNLAQFKDRLNSFL
jgi:hypothetical protein